MKLFNLTSASLLLILGGCAVPRQVAFNEADFAHAAAKGGGVITGRAYVVTDDQGTLYPHYQAIVLAPVNAYTTENVQRRFLKGENLQTADPRLDKYVRVTATDNHGNFTIRGIPSGDYYLEGRVPWVTSYDSTDDDGIETTQHVNHSKLYFTRVTVASGQTVRVTRCRADS